MQTPRRQPKSALFRLASRAVGGDMHAYLRKRRKEDATFEEIARDITDALKDQDVPVSPTAVYRWAVSLGVHEKAAS